MTQRQLACLSLFVAAIFFACSNGGMSIAFADLWQRESTAAVVFWQIRLPRIVVGSLCGLALAAAGVLSQGLFRNALASPSIIGTTAGGGAAAAVTFYTGLAASHWLVLPAAACLGSALATLIILAIASYRRFFIVENLLLAGFALNALLSSLTSLLVSLTLEDHEKFPAAMYWLMGGLSGKTWDHALLGVLPITVGLVAGWRLCAKLDVLTLGEEVAQSLAVSPPRLRRAVIVLVAVLVGSAISMAGAITFVGLIVPHLTRLLIGPKHRPLLIFSAINGATLVVVTDTFARTFRSPNELQVGILIALMGAPFFFWLLLQNRRPWEERT